MKVLLVSSLYPPNVLGGAERSVQLLAETLFQRGHRVSVVTTQPEGLMQRRELNGVRVRYVPVRNVYRPFSDGVRQGLKPLWHLVDSFNPLMGGAIARILAEERPDLLHTNTLAGFSPTVWSAARRMTVPVVHTIRDHYLLCVRASMFHRGKNCARRCAVCWVPSQPRVAATKHVNAVTAVSRYMLDHHLAFGAFQSTSLHRVIHNAYQPSPDMSNSAGTDESATSGPLRVGFLGRLHPTKGVELLLEAVRQLNGGTVKTMLAGRGEAGYESELRQRFESRDVEFMGFTRPEQLLSRVDVLVVPALWHEPFPRVTFEAYAHGVPVIGSRRGGIPEAIDEGETGFLFDPDSPGELAARLEQLVRDRTVLRRMAMSARSKAAAFEPNVIAAQYESVYHEVV